VFLVVFLAPCCSRLSGVSLCKDVSSNVLKPPDDLGLTNFHGLYTRAPEMETLLRRLGRVAATDSTVLVRGESGSGKELVARAVHTMSPRRHREFRAINCATLSPTLLESELFGHRRGAFTGAVSDHRGLFSQADGGTILLDEVAEIPLDLQARLLRVVEDRTFVPVGGTKPVQVDVRIVSATHRALRRAVAEGRFRDDLRYRLRVVPLFLPPLRQRTGDVEALVWHFIRRFNERGPGRIEAVARPAMRALRSYPWPGNVRELRNVIEYAFVIGEDDVLDIEDLTPELRGEEPPDDAPVFGGPLAEGERQRILSALERHGGRRAGAAKALGMSRTTLWHKMKKHHLA
jgi:transcriptional regulator with PAS, ATPase and Fis domain